MSGNDHTSRTASADPLRSWIGTILLGMNLLMTVLGTVAIFRYRWVALKVFEDFEVELPAMTEVTLSVPYAALLPLFGLAAIAVRFLSKDNRINVIIYTVHFLIIIMIAGLFVGTVLPTMSRLMSELS